MPTKTDYYRKIRAYLQNARESVVLSNEYALPVDYGKTTREIAADLGFPLSSMYRILDQNKSGAVGFGILRDDRAKLWYYDSGAVVDIATTIQRESNVAHPLNNSAIVDDRLAWLVSKSTEYFIAAWNNMSDDTKIQLYSSWREALQSGEYKIVANIAPINKEK